MPGVFVNLGKTRPARQGVHSAALVSALYVPGPHSLQLEAPEFC